MPGSPQSSTTCPCPSRLWAQRSQQQRHVRVPADQGCEARSGGDLQAALRRRCPDHLVHLQGRGHPLRAWRPRSSTVQ